jgi:hypothetical protein
LSIEQTAAGIRVVVQGQQSLQMTAVAPDTACMSVGAVIGREKSGAQYLMHRGA